MATKSLKVRFDRERERDLSNLEVDRLVNCLDLHFSLEGIVDGVFASFSGVYK